MSDIVITLNKKIDRTTVVNETTIRLVNNYAPEADAVLDTTYGDLPSGEQEELKSVLDYLTYEIEPDAKVWNIVRTGKEFDLSTSYIRDREGTLPGGTPIPDGDSLLIRFEVPGFETGSFREVNLFYNDDFNPAELTALEEIGIEITGNGTTFEITNVIQCKVSFTKPELVTDFYIINDPGINNVIAV